MEFYLEVDELYILWDGIKDKLSGIKVWEPFNREYGARDAYYYSPN